MIYLQPRRRKSISATQLRIGVLLVGVCLAVAVLGAYVLQGAVQTGAYPFMHISNGIGGFFGATGSMFTTKLSLQEENTRLKQDMRSNSHLIASERTLMRENAELKEILGRTVSQEVRLAAILARPPFLMYDSLIVDVGLGSAVAVGDRVYAKGNVVIGEVSAVYPQTSLVTLFSAPGKELQVRVGTTTLTAKGRGLGNYLLEVPREYVVATGTEVLLPSLEVSLLGIVDTVEAHPADPVQNVYVRAPLSLSEVYFVTIVKRSLVTNAEIDAKLEPHRDEHATSTAKDADDL